MESAEVKAGRAWMLARLNETEVSAELLAEAEAAIAALPASSRKFWRGGTTQQQINAFQARMNATGGLLEQKEIDDESQPHLKGAIYDCLRELERVRDELSDRQSTSKKVLSGLPKRNWINVAATEPFLNRELEKDGPEYFDADNFLRRLLEERS
jgi:hypothetical protein